MSKGTRVSIPNYRIEPIVFVSGAIVMILELVGSRIVAPYFGDSLYVWAGLIGVILGSLSLGYYLGGIISDKRPTYSALSLIIFLSGSMVALIAFFKEPILIQISSEIKSLQWSSLISVIVLFFLPSTLLGMVSPYAVKLKLKEITGSGKTVGSLYALSTLGSIVGTFAAGFVLIPLLGNTALTFILAIALMLLALIASLDRFFIKIIILIATIVLYLFSHAGVLRLNAIADIDSSYSRIVVAKYTNGSREIVAIKDAGVGLQSASYADGSDELVFDYTKSYELAVLANPNLKNSLMIGGAGFTYPRYFAKKYPDRNIDVVEIDPKYIDIAKKYFFLGDYPNLKIYSEDARNFPKKTHDKYDAIYLDAFNSITPPYYLTTTEFFADIKRSLTPNGILMTNVIGQEIGPNSDFYQSEVATLATVFPNIQTINFNQNKNKIGNIMVITSEKPLVFQNTNNNELSKYVNILNAEKPKTNVKILTDDHAPVEYLTRNYLN